MNMENVHLAPEGDSDDIYSGYDYNDPMIDVSHCGRVHDDDNDDGYETLFLRGSPFSKLLLIFQGPQYIHSRGKGTLRCTACKCVVN